MIKFWNSFCSNYHISVDYKETLYEWKLSFLFKYLWVDDIEKVYKLNKIEQKYINHSVECLKGWNIDTQLKIVLYVHWNLIYSSSCIKFVPYEVSHTLCYSIEKEIWGFDKIDNEIQCFAHISFFWNINLQIWWSRVGISYFISILQNLFKIIFQFVIITLI